MKRRQLMQLGAAGMPMMFTLKAHANAVVVSQLQCLITIPSGWNIMVDDQGAAWLGDFKIKKKMKSGDIENIKANVTFVFPAGTVPNGYRPTEGCGKKDEKGENAPCNHAFYELGKQSNEFPISDYVDENGTWSLSGSEGLYVLLAQEYAEQYGDTEGFPGVSCLVSVINYLNMNS